MLSVTETLERIASVRPLPPETVGLAAAAGRVLQESVRADRDLPPFDRALVDGYAVRAASLGAGGGRLRIVDEIPAGRVSRVPVREGEAAAIMTGAPMPKGADAAVMVEHTVRQGDFMRWPAPGSPNTPMAPGQRVMRRGREVRAGTTLLEPGIRLTAAAVGVLATVGKTRIRVGRRPTVSVLSTGDELTHPRTRSPRPAQIRDANSHMIAARCRTLGLRTQRLGFVRDDRSRLTAAIKTGLAADVLFISGGVSMGRFDFVEPMLEAQGIRLHLSAVAIRPGKPFVFGTGGPDGRTLAFGLPGNPVSALTTFEVLARTALDRLEGHRDPMRPRIAARLAESVTNRGPRQAFLPARVHAAEDGELLATPIRSAGSADIAALALSNALLIVPPGAGTVPPGRPLMVQPLLGFPDPGPGWSDRR